MSKRRETKAKTISLSTDEDNTKEREMIQKLEKIKLNDTIPWFTCGNRCVVGKCMSIYDGDTVTIAFPFESSVYLKRCRLAKLDTAEIKTRNQKEKEVAIKAREFLQDRILSKIIYVRCFDEDKYGRLLVNIYETREDMHNNVNDLSSQIITRGLGYRYEGDKKKTFDEWYKEEK